MTIACEFGLRAARLWHLHRVRRMVREQGGFGPQTLVSVTEFLCDDPNCPGPATRITILAMDLTRRVLVIHRPAREISGMDIAALIDVGRAVQRTD